MIPRLRIVLPLLGLLLALLPVGAFAQAEDPLVQAYQLEKQALEEELAALRGELDRFQADHVGQAESLRQEVSGLRARLTALGLEADREESRLDTMRVEQDGGASQQELLLVTIDQAFATLERYDLVVEGAQELSDEDALAAALAGAGSTLGRVSSVRTEPGSFFLPDGREADGEVLHFGQIAAFGMAGDQRGALAPAGAGTLQLQPDEEGTLQAWLDGDSKMLDLYLLDAASRDHQARAELTLWEHVASGGVLVWPILALGLLAALLAAERAFTLRRLHSGTDGLLKVVLAKVAKGELQEANQACEADPGAPSRVLLAGLSHWHLPKDQLEDVLKEAIVRELPRLERALPIIAVVAAVAPLLGLLGTVTGMISTFEVITEHGTGDPKMLSGGISVALVTTQLGLAVAIPVLLVHNLLSTLSDHVGADMYKAALVLSNALYKQESFRLDDGRWVSRAYDLRDEPTGEIEFRRDSHGGTLPIGPSPDGPPPGPPLMPWPGDRRPDDGGAS